MTPDDLARWRDMGWLHLRDVLDGEVVADLRSWVDEIEGWAASGGPGMHHHEQTPTGPAVARSEDLVPHHPGLAGFVTGGALIEQAAALLGEDAVLYKEKVNYKHPGGGGFAPHQDAAAYRFVDHHVSVMVPLDPSTVESGCLLVAGGHHDKRLATDERGRIEPDVAARLDFRPVEAEPGDLLWFDSYTPHRSGTNRSSHPRRALYLTYNGARHGDLRARYYADKRAAFAADGDRSGDGERVRLSISDDFLGRPVAVAGSEAGQDRVVPARMWSELHDRAVPRPVTVDDLLALLDGPAARRRYDEAVTDREHALQTADRAIEAGAGPPLVAAALLHDIGHLLLDDHVPLADALTADAAHEAAGAVALEPLFGPDVAGPVARHVAAKRFLCATEAYERCLSEASRRSLAVQGGSMSPGGVARFRAEPGWQDAVAVRRWDDRAKVPGLSTRPLDSYRRLLTDLLVSSG